MILNLQRGKRIMTPDVSKGVINILDLNIEKVTAMKYLGIGIRVILILIFSKIIIKVLSTVIHKFFSRQKQLKFGLNEKKADTLSELLKNVVRYIVYFIAAIWIFESIGLDIKTVIAVTSVAGVAIGFGAQSLIKDVITGFFILFEDQFSVGDYVEIDGKSGIVEVLGLRITKIRDFSGDLHIIPNGSIVKVTNKSRGNMRAMVDVDISYDEDIERATSIISAVNEKMKKDFSQIVEGPDVIGVTKLGDTGITIRVIAKTVPMKQWDVEMELRKRIIYALDAENIKIPYPKKIILSGEGERK
jgi:small conductance mechanosensitive channel